MRTFQTIQNAATRVLYRLTLWSHEHITPFLKRAHWLKIPERIEYRFLTLVHKCVYEGEPSNLAELLQRKTAIQEVRRTSSMDDLQLVVPRSRLRMTEKSFAVAGPKLWNNLTKSLRAITFHNNFKKNLNTWLFNRA